VKVQNLIDSLKQIRLFLHQFSGNSQLLSGIMYKHESLICDSKNMYINVQFFKTQASAHCSKKWFTSTGLVMVYQYFSLALPWLVIQSLFIGT
jgi:hypothetical protein